MRGEKFKEKLKKNLVPLNELVKVAKNKKIDKYIKKIGYSKQRNKKYFVINNNNKKIDFGDINYEDFLTTKDIDKQKKYHERHKHDNINNPDFAGYWSYHLLW